MPPIRSLCVGDCQNRHRYISPREGRGEVTPTACPSQGQEAKGVIVARKGIPRKTEAGEAVSLTGVVAVARSHNGPE